jgi:hypothetical protein
MCRAAKNIQIPNEDPAYVEQKQSSTLVCACRRMHGNYSPKYRTMWTYGMTATRHRTEEGKL